MKDKFYCPVSTSIEFKYYILSIESYIIMQAGQISFFFCFDKEMVSCLCACFAHRSNMEVKIHKTWIAVTVDYETCFSLNY